MSEKENPTDEDIEAFVNEMKRVILELANKHSLRCFPAIVAVPISMLDRILKAWKEGKNESSNNM